MCGCRRGCVCVLVVFETRPRNEHFLGQTLTVAIGTIECANERCFCRVVLSAVTQVLMSTHICAYKPELLRYSFFFFFFPAQVREFYGGTPRRSDRLRVQSGAPHLCLCDICPCRHLRHGQVSEWVFVRGLNGVAALALSMC